MKRDKAQHEPPEYVDTGFLGIETEEQFEALCKECAVEVEERADERPKVRRAGEGNA